jgi:pilus assembly protein CpaE
MLSLLFNKPHARVATLPAIQEVVQALLPTEQAAPPAVMAPPPVIGVLGAKGGVGATTVAINLAAALSSECNGSTLLDANLQQPDVANILGVDVHYSLLDLLAKQEFNSEMLDACCNNVPTADSLKVLSVPPNVQTGLHSNLSQVAECLDSVRGLSKSWVVDLPRYLDKHLVEMIDRCSLILVVFEPTIAGVGAARRWLRLLDELEYKQERVQLVINRSGSKLRTVEKEVCNAFNNMTVFKIPNAYEMAEVCTVEGAPAVTKFPSSAYARAIKGMAKQIKEAL